MDQTNGIEALYEAAADYRFQEFEALLFRGEGAAGRGRREALLLLAQIKALAGDESLVRDLEEAGGAAPPPERPCLGSRWQPDSPNRYIVFRREQGALGRFLGLLPRAAALLDLEYGEGGGNLVRQLQSEIHYFRGELGECNRLGERLNSCAQTPWDQILARYVLFRCRLAAGEAEEAAQSMLEIVALTKAYPACIPPYRVIRAWANLTTGWSGDTPRFAGGPYSPVLEDRLDAIRSGIACLSHREEAIAAWAGKRHPDTYSMRRYYMDIFHAVYWFQAGDMEQAKGHFGRAHELAAASGLIMPFVEYGGQLLPLLEFVAESGPSCDREWLENLAVRARAYEEGLRRYRK